MMQTQTATRPANAQDLTQEQWHNAKRVYKQLYSDTPPSDLGDIDIGAASILLQRLIKNRATSIGVLERTVQGLAIDNPIIEQLEQERTKISKYKPISVSELLNMPMQRWILTNVLYEDAITAVYGTPGCGKSFIALAWSICLALGIHWLGRPTQQRCRVVYVAAEGVRGYQRRIRAWCNHFGRKPGDIERYISFIPCAVPLGNSAEVEEFIATILDALDAYSDNLPVVIVLDTVFQCAAGMNINATEVMTGLIETVKRIKAETKASNVILVHHSGKDKERGMSGNIALLAGVDIAYHVEKDADNNIVMRATKVKDDEYTEAFFYLQRIVYDEGERDNSCVILHRERPVQSVKLTPTQQSMLEVLPVEGQGLRYSDWKKAYDAAIQKSAAKQTFIDNMKKLIEKGLVQETLAGTESGTDYKAYLRKKQAEEGAVNDEV